MTGFTAPACTARFVSGQAAYAFEKLYRLRWRRSRLLSNAGGALNSIETTVLLTVEDTMEALGGKVDSVSSTGSVCACQ